jgi:hypothetical protein
MLKEYNTFFDRAREQRLLVIGDVMLDEFIWGRSPGSFYGKSLDATAARQPGFQKALILEEIQMQPSLDAGVAGKRYLKETCH